MREILFRGKRTKNGEWVYGYYTKARDYLNGKEMHIIFPPDVEAFPHCEFTEYEEVIPETVCQFTGLYDKNGRKIFEGDIILYRQIPCVVKYNAKTAHYSLYIYGKIEISGFNHDTMKLANIIGNIYDNPELLEGS